MIVIESLINGGASTTIYRSGKPVIGQICAMERAFESWRISLRHLVKEEINKFLEIFDKCYKSVK